MFETSDKFEDSAASTGLHDFSRLASEAETAAAVPESDEERDARIVRDEFEGIDNDLVDVAKFADDRVDEKGHRSVGQDAPPEDKRTDTADLSVSEYDRSGGRG